MQYQTHPAQATAAPPAAYTHNPKFPNLPEDTPLTVVLTMAACLSDDPAERPTFVEVSQILTDVRSEVRSGAYIDSHAQPQVPLPPLFVSSGTQPLCLEAVQRLRDIIPSSYNPSGTYNRS